MSILYPVSVSKKPDSSLSDVSENSVQNKVITQALNSKQDAPTTYTGVVEAGNEAVVFTNDLFANDVIIANILTNNENTIIVNAEQDKSTKSITITILPMDVDVTVLLYISIPG